MKEQVDLRISTSILIRALKVLPKRDRAKVILVALLQVLLSLLDLLAVALIGVLGSVALTGIQSRPNGNRVNSLLEVLRLDGFQFQQQVAILACISAFILITRTIFSIIFIRKIFMFLSFKGAEISSGLVSKLLGSNLLTIQKQADQDILYQTTQGVNALTLGILANGTTLLSDTSLLVVLMVGLFLVDPTIAISSIILFGGLGFILYLNTNKKAQKLGESFTKLTIQSNQEILEVLSTYRETLVRNRRYYYSRRISEVRHKLSSTTGELQFMPHVGKYIIESGIVLGAILVSGIQFLMQDAAQAVATLSVFLAAGTRIAPAIMRIQNGAISFRSHMSGAEATLALVDSLDSTGPIGYASDGFQTEHDGFEASVKLMAGTLIYPDSNVKALDNLSIEVLEGELVAIVGSSGAGKTSLVDVLLGVVDLSGGTVLISGLPPLQAISKWPGSISYVPQDVVITNTSVKENVALGFPLSQIDDTCIWRALNVAQLSEFIETLPEKLETLVGERGTKISGGQRQRLGIARAMYTKPRLLVLDEATSSLDGQTESDISNAIQRLRGDVTVVMIAHRLSTVRNADKVVYMDSGKILAIGTFEEVRSKVPDFDSQAALMGLK
jgi:ABC-type multidrug transport system fused ATPase/permease subunit